MDRREKHTKVFGDVSSSRPHEWKFRERLEAIFKLKLKLKLYAVLKLSGKAKLSL